MQLSLSKEHHQLPPKTLQHTLNFTLFILQNIITALTFMLIISLNIFAMLCLQYSWAPLVALTVKNPPAMLETWVLSLDWEDPLEEGMATHSNIRARRIPMYRGAWRATVCVVTKSQTRLSD